MQTNPWGSCVENGVATLACIPAVFKNIISSLFVFAGIVAAILIIASAYKFIVSRGDPKKLHTAKASLAYTFLGLVLIIFAYFIVNLIAYISGAHCISFWGWNFSNCK